MRVPASKGVVDVALTDLEKIDRELVSYGKQLARAEANLDFDMITIYTADIDRLLDERLKLNTHA